MGDFYGCNCGALYERRKDRDACMERGHSGPLLKPCPQCARIAEKLDREKIARTPADDGAPGYYDKQDKYVKDHYRSRADIAIDYFKE